MSVPYTTWNHFFYTFREQLAQSASKPLLLGKFRWKELVRKTTDTTARNGYGSHKCYFLFLHYYPFYLFPSTSTSISAGPKAWCILNPWEVWALSHHIIIKQVLSNLPIHYQNRAKQYQEAPSTAPGLYILPPLNNNRPTIYSRWSDSINLDEMVILFLASCFPLTLAPWSSTLRLPSQAY